MAENTGRIQIDVEIIPHLERARQEAAKLAAQVAASPTATPPDRASAIAREIALTRQLADERIRLLKSEQKPAAEIRSSQQREAAGVRALLTERVSGVDSGTESLVRGMVGTPALQRQYAGKLMTSTALGTPALGPSTELNAAISRQIAAINKQTQGLARAGESEEFVGALRELDTETKRFFTTMEEARLASSDYTEAAIQAAVAQRELTALIRVSAESETAYIESTAALAQSRRRLQQETVLSLHGVSSKGLTPEEVQDKAAELQRRQRLTSTARQATGVTPEEVQERAAVRAANTRVTAATREQSLVTEGYTRDLGRSAVIQQREQVARNDYIRAISAASGEGTGYQRFKTAIAPNPTLPALQPTGMQDLLSRGIRSAEFTISGFATGAAIFGLVDAVKDATKLQESLAGLKGQLGELGRAGDFEGMRAGIKGISQDTGEAATEVTAFAQRLIGLYDDPSRALAETRSAMELAVVSGVDLKTMLEELVPVARAFNIPIEQIGDAAVGLHDKFGIAESDSLQFFGATAATAKEAGFTFAQLGPIGAAAANAVGESMSAAGDQFAKVIDTMSQNQDKIFAVYRRRPETAGLADPIIEALGQGRGGDAFKLMLQSYNQLDAVQQQNLVRVSGSRREWALLNGLFSHSNELIQAITESEQSAGESSGRLGRRFEEVRNTILETTQRLKELINNLVEGLVSSGIGDALNFILQGFERIFSMASDLLRIFSALNDKMKFGPFDQGALVFIASVVAGLLILDRVWRGYAATKQLVARGSELLNATETQLGITTTATAAARTEEAAAEDLDAAAKQNNAVVTGEAATAEGAETTAVELNTAARRENAIATAASTGEAAAGGVVSTAGPAVGAAVGTRVGAAGAETAAGTAAQAGEVVTTNLLGETVITGTAAAGGAGLLRRGAARAATGASEATGRVSGRLSAEYARLTGKETATAVEEGVTEGAEQAATKGGLFSGLKTSLMTQISGVMEGGLGGLASTAFAPGPLLAQVATGLVSTNWARSAALEGGGPDISLPFVGAVTPGALHLEDRQKEAREQVRGMSQQQRDKLIADSKNQNEFFRLWDRAQTEFFDIDLPAAMAEQENALKTGEGGRRFVGNVIGTGKTKDFARGISDANLKMINDWIASEGDAGKGAAEQFGLYDDHGQITRDTIEKNLPRINEAAGKGDVAANSIIATLGNVGEQQKSLAAVRQAVDDALKSGNVNAAIDAAGGIDQFLATQYDPKGALEAGLISPAQYLNQAQQSVNDQKKLLAGAKDQAAAYKALDAKVREADQYRDQLILARVDRLNRVTEQESSTPKADILARSLEVLPTLSYPDQLAQLDKLYDASRAAFDEQVASIKDPWEKYQAKLRGRPIAPEVQSLDIQSQLRESTAAEPVVTWFGENEGGGPEGEQSALQKLADEAVRTGQSVKDVIIKRLEEWIAIKKELKMDSSREETLLATARGMPDITTPGTQGTDRRQADIDYQRDALKQTESEIALAKSQQVNQGKRAQARENLRQANEHLAELLREQKIGGPQAPSQADINNAQAGVNDALRQSAQITEDTADAMAEWSVIDAWGDPVRQNKAKLDNANRKAAETLRRVGGDVKDPDYIKSLQDARQAEITLIQSQQQHDVLVSQWAEIRDAKDPLRTLQDQLATAQRKLGQALENAHGDLNADPVIQAQQEIAKIEAQIGDEISAGIEARANLAIGIAEAQGDTVKAAVLTAQEAQRKLDEAVNAGIDDDKILAPLRQNALKTSEDAAKAGRSREEQITDFQLQMGQITTEAAIESLRLILSRTREGTDEYMQLALKIHQLEQQAGQDLQFNLPTNLGLPTLYEARRVTQSTAAGIGYQDNRNVNLLVQVNGAQDPMTVTNQVVSALQSAMGGGATLTPQVGMGA